jgi:hypothetical protein
MKKNSVIIIAILFLAMSLSSCYTYTFNVGKGAQTNVEVTKWNHYVIYGLAPVSVSNFSEMAGGAKDYTVTIQHSFLNGLIRSLTYGIYTPTTTTVTK